MDREEFLNKLRKFVKKYQETNIIDEYEKSKILQIATAWNKEEVMNEMIKRLDEFKLYEEEVGFFSLRFYYNQLLSENEFEEKLD